MALRTDLEGLTVAGRYELRAHLATGGMATVFRGWDLHMRRPVAVKLLRDDAADLCDTELARFRREAHAVAALRCPHIVKLYDFVECDGRVCLIMELVDGPNLKQRILDAGPLAVEEALTYAIHVCRALAQTHAHGYIHRDVKPQNILLASSGTTKLTDFGIVQIGGGPSLTASGLVLGTADYIAPEQAQGLTLEPASDLYSLGIVLFEMLTAAVPFTGATATAVALRHMAEPLPSLRPRNPAVPPLVERIVRRASAKDPARRFTSAAQMEAALIRALAACNHRPAESPTGATCPGPDRPRAMNSTAQAQAPADPDQAGGAEEVDEPDWHDAALLLPSLPWWTVGDAPDALAESSDETSTTLLLPAIADRAKWEPFAPGGLLPVDVMRWIERLGAGARLALTLGVAVLLLVAILVLRMLP